MMKLSSKALRATLASGAVLAAFWAAPALAQAKIQMRIASVLDQSSTIYEGLDVFTKKLNELTGDRFNVIVYKGSLGKGERQLYEAVQIGTLEAVLSTTGPLSAFVPEADLFNLPFLFRNAKHAFEVVDGEIGAEFGQKTVPKGFRVLGWWVTGARNTSNNVRPINSPGDYKGMKIRTMESPPFMALYRAMGAVPIPMAITEVYGGLSQGSIDGIDGSLSSQLAFKHIEVLKYGAVTDHVVLLYPFTVSERWFKSLAPDLQDALRKAEAAARPAQRAADEQYEKSVTQEWVKLGKTITYPDVKKFQEIADTIYPQFYDKVGGKQLIDRVRAVGSAK